MVKTRKWIVRILQDGLVVMFVMAGMSKLTMGSEELRRLYTEPLGYGEGFMYVIAVVELLSVVGLIVGYWNGKWALLGAGALTVVMAGAVISVPASGQGEGQALLPFVLLVGRLDSLKQRRNTVRKSGTDAA